MILNKDKKFPILIIDNWFNKVEEKAVWKELEFYLSNQNSLTRTETDGNITTIKGRQKGKSFRIYPQRFLKPEFKNTSNVLKLFSKYQDKSFHKVIEKSMPHGRYFSSTDMGSCFISYYEEGDYYQSHFDRACFSSVVWLNKEPRQYKGGNLYFKDSDVSVECLNNRMCIFPSYYLHEVDKLEWKKQPKDRGYGRFTLTYFFSFDLS
jgi:hypothetical protein|tara:strand:- start:4612 stop:5232 length:621 start_codon:yes stop_codon:yes gene_type:complete